MRLMNRSGVVCLGLCALVASASAAAADGERNFLGIEKASIENSSVPADRPGFYDSVQLVPKGHFEMEGGFRFDDNQTGGDSYTIPSSVLLRTGLTDNIELRLGFGGYNINAPGNDGAGNTSVGFKVHIHDETTYTPAFSVLPTVSLPSGDNQVAVSQAEPELHFIVAKSLTDNLSFGGNLNLAERLNSATGNRDIETALAGAFGYAFTSRLSGYAEYYSVLPTIPGADDTDAVDGGFTFLTAPHTQLDAYVGAGLNDVASKVYAGVGIAHLF